MADISYYSKEQHTATVRELLREKLAEHRIHDWPDISCNASELDYAICWHPPQSFFRGADNLTAIFSLAAGVDHLLGHSELPPEVPIVRLVDAGMGDKIAEYVHYGVLRSHRGFDQYQQQQRSGLWKSLPDRHAADYRVGVLGYGVIGRTVAMRLYQGGYQVTAFRRSSAPNIDPFPVLSENRAEFLNKLDTLVCVLPLTAQTTGMINSELLSALPAGAHFINVGRGDQVVEEDLVAALDNGQLGSAMLDVCSVEPLPEDHPLWNHDKITITPHIAGPTQVAQSVSQIAESILLLEAGADIGKIAGVVDYHRGY